MKASDNETVAEIVKEMRRDAVAADAWCETHGEMASAASVLNRHADRVEAAHRREVAELQRRLKVAEDALEKCMTAMCNYCRSTPEAKGLPCLNGCETLAIAKNALAAIREEGGAK